MATKGNPKKVPKEKDFLTLTAKEMARAAKQVEAAKKKFKTPEEYGEFWDKKRGY